jgi:hypothetical protein
VNPNPKQQNEKYYLSTNEVMNEKDFTISAYRSLLAALKEQNYTFQTVSGFIDNPADRTVMLRHDVDARKTHSLEFAKIQHREGIVGTYYFRMVPQSFDEGVIREIYNLGHEIGYHYEDMAFTNGDPHKAIKLFEKHLDKLRQVAPIRSICMHGSPASKFDNRDVWKHYNYRDFGIETEPYFDIDFRKVFYLTDTGRRWDGFKVSVRDRVEDHFGISFHSTQEIVKALKAGQFPEKVMFNFHPQRWTGNMRLWWQDAGVQLMKNSAKYWLIKWREKNKK